MGASTVSKCRVRLWSLTLSKNSNGNHDSAFLRHPPPPPPQKKKKPLISKESLQDHSPGLSVVYMHTVYMFIGHTDISDKICFMYQTYNGGFNMKQDTWLMTGYNKQLKIIDKIPLYVCLFHSVGLIDIFIAEQNGGRCIRRGEYNYRTT